MQNNHKNSPAKSTENNRKTNPNLLFKDNQETTVKDTKISNEEMSGRMSPLIIQQLVHDNDSESDSDSELSMRDCECCDDVMGSASPAPRR